MEKMYWDKQRGCGGLEYYFKFLGGAFLHLLLPGLQHLMIGQTNKAVAICIVSFILRYVILSSLGGFLYYVNSQVGGIAGKVIANIISFLVVGLIFSNEVAIFFDFNQLCYRLYYGYPVAQDEYSVKIFAFSGSKTFMTWLPINAPHAWISESRKIDEEIKRR